MWIEWISLVQDNKVLNLASFYYSPDHQFDKLQFDPISKDIELMNNIYNDKDCYFSINGDFNSKSEIWGFANDDR